MREPELRDGARALLFERLVDRDPGAVREAVPMRTLGRVELKQSLQRELQRLLNTRCPFPAEEVEAVQRTVIDYGLPDYSSYYTKSPEDQARVARLVRQTVEAFEPRLREVSVEVKLFRHSLKALQVLISGILTVGEVMELVSFEIDVHPERDSQ